MTIATQWVEARSAETHGIKRWVSLTLNPSYVNSRHSKLPEISSLVIKELIPFPDFLEQLGRSRSETGVVIAKESVGFYAAINDLL